VRNYYRVSFGLHDQRRTRIAVFRTDSADPPSHETLICLAGNRISATLIAEGADPLLCSYDDPQPITAREFVAVRGGRS